MGLSSKGLARNNPCKGAEVLRHSRRSGKPGKVLDPCFYNGFFFGTR